jgi:ribosomal protein S6--L-glutamate ligase
MSKEMPNKPSTSAKKVSAATKSVQEKKLSSPKKQDLKIIGNKEWCGFEAFKIPAILARIDSGAKTSSIQATDIKLVRKKKEDWVQFVVNPIQNNTKIAVSCLAKVVDKRSIKGSFGISEERFIIKSDVSIGDDTFPIELSLANRNTMEYRMLLGREAIAKRYLINPALVTVQKKYTRLAISAMYSTNNKKSVTKKGSA